MMSFRTPTPRHAMVLLYTFSGWPRGEPSRTSVCRGHYVRFGSKADMCAAKSDVRFTPNSDRKSRHPRTVTSALPLDTNKQKDRPNVRETSRQTPVHVRASCFLMLA